ncbi:MAG: hypothetical protein AB4352_10945 [Hormoscilla sp.]
MAYSEFTTIAKARETFNLMVEEKIHLFTEIEPIAPSDYLKITLDENLPLANAINTEKARSELIITPVLLEVRRILNFQIGFFSGTDCRVPSGTEWMLRLYPDGIQENV